MTSTASVPSPGPSSPTSGLRRVHPAPVSAVSVREAYSADRPPHLDAPRPGPWLGACMVTSLDGSVTIDGTSGGLGNANDRDVLLTLRELADVVIVGAATASGEGYGAPSSGTRIGVVTNRGRIDPTSELFRSGAGFVITSTTTEIPAGIDVVRAGRERVDLAAALGLLDEVTPDVRYVHAEGGPSLNAALLELDLVDELDLTIAPLMVGGTGPRVSLGEREVARRFDLAHLLIDDEGYTFGRWVRRSAATSPRLS